MKDFNPIDFQKYNGLATDYKTEVIAYNLWKNNTTIDGVFLKRLGSNNRNFYKDLKRIKVEVMDVKERIISVESYREGLYDYLPEGLFHPPSFKNSQQHISAVVDQIRYEKKVEQKLRSFFQPFELEVYFSHLRTLELADGFEGMGQCNHFIQMLEKLWPLLKLLDNKNARVFAYILPHFHSARGNKIWIEKCLSALLDIPVSLRFTSSKMKVVDVPIVSILLSDMQLGVTTVLIDDHFDGTVNWEFHYGPITYEKVHLYLEGSPLRALLRIIYDYCLPTTVTVVEIFNTLSEEQAFSMNNTNNSLLGYSTYL